MITAESAAVAELKVKDRSIFTIDSAEKEDTWIKF